MSQKFSILHLSDAHIGNPRYSQDAASVLRALIDDITKFSRDHQIRPNLIVFNGDLAWGNLQQSPLGEQYDQARSFLSGILTALNTSFDKTPILLVPGNHDIDRSKIDDSQTTWVKTLSGETGEQTLYEKMQGADILFKRMLERQANWYQFARSLPDQPWNWSEQFFTPSGILKFGPHSIGVVGINSSWASHTQSEKGFLWIGKFQLQKALDNVKSAEFRIAVAHHPVSWLNSAEEGHVQQRLESDYRIFLHGHDHTTWVRDLDNHLMVAAGACYQGSTKPNGYSYIVIDFQARTAHVQLRSYSDAGSGGWVPAIIPEKTNNEGCWKVSHLFNRETHPALGQNVVALEPAGPADAPTLAQQPTIQALIARLENMFSFRWEPASFQTTTAPSVYWPMRLREPTPIHAVQAFAAAALQRAGADVVLWLDDLGTNDYSPETFLSKVDGWFGKVGGDSSRLSKKRFTQVLAKDDAENVWPLLRKWIGTSEYKMEEILRVAKLWPDIQNSGMTLDDLGGRRPRRLLTPPAVWTCLMEVKKEYASRPIITLGGYDEQSLWQAWRECSDPSAAQVGHLYIPKLEQETPDRGRRDLHMSRTSLAWHSKEDIRSSLEADGLGSTSESVVAFGNGINRMIPWCLSGCVLLPSFVASVAPDLRIGNRPIQGLADLAGIDAPTAIPALVDAISKWLLTA